MAAVCSMPEGFTKRVHQALRTYHSQQSEDVLGDLLLAHELRAGHVGAVPRLVGNQVLTHGLDHMKRSGDGEAANLLERRFLNQETAWKLAGSLNVSEDVVYQRQRAAITRLAEVLWGLEQELRRRRVQRIEARLEPPTYTRLFGVAEKLAEARAQIEVASEPWLLALEGLGGIGKTSLADALVRELAGESYFHEIGWVSARRRLFRLSGEVEIVDGRPALTPAELVDRLLEQFHLTGLQRRSEAEKWAGLKGLLRSQSCLVVVDNLETAADADALISRLGEVAGPSKFLFTTRCSLRAVSGVYTLTLRELERGDAQALLRHEAATRGLGELADAPETVLDDIYAVTGGNPLAMKLIVGQVHTLSLPVALGYFSAAKGKPVEELLTFIHDHAWQSLDSDSRRVLQAMLLVPDEGGRLDQIAAAAELDDTSAASCLTRLAGLALVNVGGTLRERRYSLHQLTHAFVARTSNEEME